MPPKRRISPKGKIGNKRIKHPRKGRHLFAFRRTIFTIESLNTTRRIDQFLLPCKEGMASGTDIDRIASRSASGFNGVSTRTGDGRVCVFWMNFLLHGFPLRPHQSTSFETRGLYRSFPRLWQPENDLKQSSNGAGGRLSAAHAVQELLI